MVDPKFLPLCSPLFDLTKKDAVLKWDSDEQTTFIALKKRSLLL
jgi:hypothetical protein